VDITMIGTGAMARAIGTRLRRAAGMQILGRDPARAQALADELGGDAGQFGEAPIRGEVVILAVPYGAAAEIAGRVGTQLQGRVVVDITNPVDFATFDRLVTPPGSSAAEEIQKLLPGARIVKAFNTIFAGTLLAGTVGGHPLDVFIASDDSGAAKTLTNLVESGGLHPIEAGPLRRSRELEAAAFLHMSVQQAINGEFRTALKILS
jgi:8-hydroxy-5-deazaflavin:NADPH oxidoreductase